MRFLLPILAFAAALAVRILPFADDVFAPEGLVPWRCPDVYYHLHRIAVFAESWPRLPEFDHYRNYPDGAYAIWSPLFDFVPATIAAWTSAPPLLVGVLWPPLLGALAVFPLLDILRRLHGRAAWLGVALFVVLPGAVSFAFLGRTDHHVGEVLMQLWVYALALRALQEIERGTVPRMRSAVALGAVMGLSLWMWRGSVVFLAVPAGAALLTLTTLRDDIARRAAARFFAVAFGLSALVALPYGLLNVVRGRDPFAAYHLSLLQPAMLLCVALLLPLARQIGETGFRIRPLLRPPVLASQAAVLAIAACAADGILAGTAFLSRSGDAWAATIAESHPIWSGGIPTYFVIEQLGFVPVLLVAIVVAQLVQLLRGWPPSPTAGFVLLATLCGTALALMQVRFVYYAAPLVVALPGGLWWALRARGRVARTAAVAFALALTWPVTRFWKPVLDFDPNTEMRPLRLEPWLSHMLAELALVTPSAGNVYEPGVRPAYCVLAPWDIGNFIQTIAERPVLASSGGPHETPAYEDTRLFLHHFTRESQAVERMRARGCRYAITEYVDPATEPGGSAQRLFARRLHLHDGSDRGAHEGSGRFRFLFESRDPRRSGVARYKVFELVPGALLRLPQGRAVRVETDVRGFRRQFTYQRRLSPFAEGTLATRVTQPGRYRILDSAGAVLGRVEVTEQAVLQGRPLVLARGASAPE